MYLQINLYFINLKNMSLKLWKSRKDLDSGVIVIISIFVLSIFYIVSKRMYKDTKLRARTKKQFDKYKL